MKRPRVLAALLLVAGCQATNVSAPPTLEWSRHDLTVDGPILAAVVSGGDGLIGVGGGLEGGSAIWTSADGLAWRMVDPVRPGRNFVDVVEGGPGFVAISPSPPGTWISSDGITWSEAPADPDLVDSQMRSIAASNGVLVAVGSGAPLVSNDGLSWRKVVLPGAGGTQYGVTAGGPGFVAVGSRNLASMRANAIVWTSIDGTAWTQVPDHPDFASAEMHGVTAADGRIVALGYANDEERNLFAGPAAWTSTDGLAWRRVEVVDDVVPVRTPESLSGALEGAIMGPTVRTSRGWISVGTALTGGAPDGVYLDLAVWTSADGTGWLRMPHRQSFELGISQTLAFGGRDVIELGDRVVIVGNTPGPRTSIWVSPSQPGGVEPPLRPTPVPAPTRGSSEATPAPAPP